ncbi:flagellar biosynthesis protein FlgK [Mobiluncus mulieris]|uniref:FlgK family flagellar hook-associated protein n=1 Tax=Mobiluncus mulieris TaxID=2052 RepID=UPI0021E22F82|nr:flagellar basal body rod C-terminal domain-containing protein [Mobiluncus mulieris]MCU9995780.1 flagellar biosynthesis protein FlgK [Mobiluncus mulieris]
MGSTFSSLNAGLTGLYAAQRLIEVSGQNIINQNTPGYTRQRVEQKALGIGSEPSIFSGSVPQGGGVEITGERRLGDFFLDSKLRMETGRAASTKEITSGWKNVESSMDELGKKSLSNAMREFYKSWGDVNNSSDNLGARATAIGNARALVDQIKTGYTHINDLWKNGRAELDALVADLNTTMDSVLALNERIRKGTAMHANVNHLIDERDKLALHISELTGATVRKGYSVYTPENAPNASMIGKGYEDGSIEIMLAGNSMVGKNYVNHFKVDGSRDMPGIDAAPREVYQKAEKALKDNVLDAEATRIKGEIPAIPNPDTDKAKQEREAVLRKYFSDEQAKIISEITNTTEQEAAIKEAMPNAKFEFHGHKIQKYQAKVGVFEKDSPYVKTDGSIGTVGDSPESTKLIGRKFVAFYKKTPKLDAKGNSLDELEDELVKESVRDFSDGSFISDEGPVRLTWTVGGHNVAIEDGRIGGLVQNLKPAEVPGVSGTIGRGGCWAETGKLYNDAATNIAKEVNLIHANNTHPTNADGRPINLSDEIKANDSRTLLTKETTFQIVNPNANLVDDPANPGKKKPADFDGNIVPGFTQKPGESDTDFDARIAARKTELENNNLIKNKYDVTSEKTTETTKGVKFELNTTLADVKKINEKLRIPKKTTETEKEFKQRVSEEEAKLKKALENTNLEVKTTIGSAAARFEIVKKDPNKPVLEVSVEPTADEKAQPPVAAPAKSKYDERVDKVKTHLEKELTDKLKNTVLGDLGAKLLDPDVTKKEVKGVKFKLTKIGTNPDKFSDSIKLERKGSGSDAEYDVAVQEKAKEIEKLFPGYSVAYQAVKEDGGDFFTFAAADNKLPPALRLGVAIDDPMKIAAGVYKNGVYDGSVALRIGNQQDSATSTLNEWGKSVVDVGVHASGARDSYNLAEQTRRIADQQQKSQSSVDMNEEVMNLIRGQHAYAGAARITSTVNSMLETLINLGR